MAFAIEQSDEQWELVADLLDPPGRRCAPASIPRRDMVDAMLFIGRTGCQWRYLPERDPRPVAAASIRPFTIRPRLTDAACTPWSGRPPVHLLGLAASRREFGYRPLE